MVQDQEACADVTCMKPPPLPPDDGQKRLGSIFPSRGAHKPWFGSLKLEEFVMAASEAAEKRRADMDDVEAEEDLAAGMQHKRRWWSSRRGASLFEVASKTPGQIVRTVIFLGVWLALLVVFVPRFDAWGFREVLSIIPFIGTAVAAYILSGIIWRSMGESARDMGRAAVRYWPLTIVILLFVLGGLRLMLAGN